MNVGEEAEAGGKRVSDHNAHHRRSRSASEKNFNVVRGKVLQNSTKKNQNDTQASPPSTSGSKGQSSSLRENFSYFNNRSSLEKDIEVLQMRLQQERAMRAVLERAMGRASSTLSPGHRHFTNQTKELIAEIESLEEEVANREQHVLSLYRNIFQQSVSSTSSSKTKTPSDRNSRSKSPSPAHYRKQELHYSRKHPSIISSPFCSSRKFYFRPLQALVSVNDSRKSRAYSSSKSDTVFGKSTPSSSLDHAVKVHEKTCVLRTLKDRLHECPSKLSEDMVKCMAFVYFWLHSSSPNNSSIDTGKNKSFTVEISWISTDHKNKFSHASYAINNYRVLVEQLEKVKVSKMETDAQTAFWINVYNSLVMHAYLAYGIPHGFRKRIALFHKAAYNIGGHVLSANSIEQSIFCLKAPRSGSWLETIISTALRKKSGEEKQLLASKFCLIPKFHPIVCFALCNGASSDPVLNVYTAANVREELEKAKRDFLQANVVVKNSRKVMLPKIIEIYAREEFISSDDVLKWVIKNVHDKKLIDSIHICIMDRKKPSKKGSQVFEWLPYNSRFRYVFSSSLTEKPWWL